MSSHPRHDHRHDHKDKHSPGDDHGHERHHHHDHADHHVGSRRSHEHNESHAHSHGANAGERILAIALGLTFVFMIVEAASGFLARSLALIADAGHMFTDAAALGLALAAIHFARKAPDSKRTFGYQRLQVLATFVNGIALLAIVAWIAIEAVQKFLDPQPVNATLMLTVASIGAVVNIVVFFMLKSGDHGDMNIAAATLHVLGDLLGSVGAVIAALVIIFTGWTPIDPILSVLLCLLIVRSAWALVKRSTHILLEGTPDWLDMSKLRTTLVEHVHAITDVHHVHCWSLSPKETLITFHASVSTASDHNAILEQAQQVLREQYGITHATIQLEYGPCKDADCE